MPDTSYQLILQKNVYQYRRNFLATERLRGFVVTDNFVVWRTTDLDKARLLLRGAISAASPKKFIRDRQFFLGCRIEKVDMDLIEHTPMIMFMMPTKLRPRVHPVIVKITSYVTNSFMHRTQGSDGEPAGNFWLTELPEHLQSPDAPVFEYLQLISLE